MDLSPSSSLKAISTIFCKSSSLTVLAWDADLRYTSNGFDYFKFRGNKWNHVNQEQRQHYLKNAYRVLMTRARQGLIIYIPEGDEEDPSRLTEYYEGTYQYLKHVGIKEI
ncbi:DUF2075 domain-containing protein [Holdemanella biformis]|nr:DUF2075 domain-containing protein [Holdemanella biformis]MBV3417022.1 DUF2075 domain-containing protein [Holdemanella biformis]